MAQRLIFRFNTADPDRRITRLVQRFPNAIRRAVSRGAVSARSFLVKTIVEETGAKAGDIRKKVTIRDATLQDLRAEVSASGKPIPLIKLNARGPYPSRGRGRGVTAWKGRLYPGAFIAVVGSGKHRGVFKRGTRKRLPIKELFGPSPADVMSKHLDAAAQVGEESMLKNLQHEYAFALADTGT